MLQKRTLQAAGIYDGASARCAKTSRFENGATWTMEPATAAPGSPAGCVKLWNVGSLQPLGMSIRACVDVSPCGPRSVSTVATHTGLSGPSTPRERGVRVRPRLRPCGGASRSLYSSSSNRPDRDRRAAAELALRDADAKIGARRGHISQLILVLFTSRTYTVCWRQAGLSVCRGPGFRRSDSLTLCPSVRGPRSRNYVCERGRVWDSKTC